MDAFPSYERSLGTVFVYGDVCGQWTLRSHGQGTYDQPTLVNNNKVDF